MHRFEPSELKALFGQLVDAVGTQEAAATFLGVSRQRVGQLIGTSWPDLPTVMQIAKLEAVCGQSVVFGALARRIEACPAQDALATGVEAAGACARALGTVHAAQADGVIEPKERDRAVHDARGALDAAQRHFDATMRMRPSLKVVGE